MNYLKDKKIIAIVLVMVVILGISLVTYGKSKNKVFKDEYMKDIFVEENQDESLMTERNTSAEQIPLEQNSEIIVVEIKGEVQKPDVYNLPEGSIVKDLIDKAGGLTSEADISRINRAKKLQNHELMVIANINDINLSQNSGINNSVGIEENGLININTAGIEELKNITGIGDVKAQSIINYREKNGGFKSIDEMKNIDGIGDKTFEKIKEQITL